MNHQYRIDFQLKKVAGKVRTLREMIKNTKTENKAELLAVTRGRLTEVLARNYDPEDRQSLSDWLKQVCEQVKNAASDLEFVIKIANRSLPVTTNVYGYAGNLAAELGNIIRKIEKSVIERRCDV